jgi:hypothetical protein
VVVEGALWGSIGAGTNRDRFPADAEERLAKFTELVATAIANAAAARSWRPRAGGSSPHQTWRADGSNETSTTARSSTLQRSQ